MASKIKLKSSNQSLSARGLPINNPVVKKRLTKKKKGVNNHNWNTDDTDSDKRKSTENGLDRCASLLAAMLESPSENIPGLVKKKTAYNRRLTSSTPVNVIREEESIEISAVTQSIDNGHVSESNTIDELIQEKELLQKYLTEIMHRSTEIKNQVEAAAAENHLSDIDQNSDVTRDQDLQCNNYTEKCHQSENELVYISENSFEDINNEDDTIISCDNPNDVTLTIPENMENNETDTSEILVSLLERITSKLKVDTDSHSSIDFTKNDEDASKNNTDRKNNNGNKNHGNKNHGNKNHETSINHEKLNNDPQSTVTNNDADDGQSFLEEESGETWYRCYNPNETGIARSSYETPARCSNKVPDTFSNEFVRNCNRNSNVADRKGITIDKIDKIDNVLMSNIIQNSSIRSIENNDNKIYREYRENLPSFLQVTLGKTIESKDGSQCDVTITQSSGISFKSGRNSNLNLKTKYSSPKENPGSSDKHFNDNPVSPDINCHKNPVLSDIHFNENPRSSVDNVGTNPMSSNINHHSNQASIHVTTLSYLIKELRSMVTAQWSIELDQLFTEIEHIINALPFLVNCMSRDTPANIEKILQPLQVENADLRRKSRFLNQKIEDLNKTLEKVRENKNISYVNNEEASVDSIIKTVQKKLGSEQRVKEALNTELADLHKKIAELEKDNNVLMQSLSEKEMKQLEESEKYMKEKSTRTQDIAVLQSRITELQINRQAEEKERNIFTLTLRQRDYEIERLSGLNRDLQESVSKLLEDISLVRRKQKHEPHYKTEEVPNHIPVDYNKIFGLTNRVSTSMELSGSQKTVENVSENESNNNSENCATVSSIKSKMSTLSETDFSLWTLATYDSSEFQKNIEHLDAEINRIQNSIKRSNVGG